MPGTDADVVVVLFRVERATRNHMLGVLRGRGMPMQHFLARLMGTLVAHPDYVETIAGWIEDAEPVSADASAS